MQDKALLGKRYTCFKCSTKFYDLNKSEPFCPKCGADQREDPTPDPKVALLQKGGRGAARLIPAPAGKPAPAEGEAAEPDEDADFDLDEDLDEEEFSEGEMEEEEEEEVEEEPE